MKNFDTNENQKIEDLLKNRMEELSSSVDCLDKITSRAFPEKNTDNSDCGITVTGLDKVYEQKTLAKAARIVALAAAVVLLVGILPTTAFIGNLQASLDKNSGGQQLYRKIIREINTEIDSFDYQIIDMTLQDYIQNDILISPMFPCPFTDNGIDGMNVRLFIKQCKDIPTNQVYAVEYKGDYSDSNFAAAASSGVEFSEKEIGELSKSVPDFPDNEELCAEAVETSFTADPDTHTLVRDGETVSAASFDYRMWFKDKRGINPLTASVLLYHPGTGKSDNFFHDIVSRYTKSEQTYDVPDDNCWKYSVTYDGKSIDMAGSSGSTKTNLFENVSNYDLDPQFRYAMLGIDPDDISASDEYLTIKQAYGLSLATIASVPIPKNDVSISTIAVYYTKGSDSDIEVYFSKSTPYSVITSYNFSQAFYPGEYEEKMLRERSLLI